MPSLEDAIRFVQERTVPARVPFVPEILLQQATELTPLWHATAAELRGWDESPFWAFPWVGGQILSRHLLDHPEEVRGKRVLDFATASGLVAIAAALAGAAHVAAADVDPFSRAAVLVNSALNGITVEFREGSPLGEIPADADVVLAGDVFYERQLATDALAWFRKLAARGIRVLAGDAWRNYPPAGGFTELSAADVPTTTEIEGAPVRPGRVLEILP